MKTAIFDTGPIISLTMNNLLWLLDPLKKRFKGKFYISRASKRELVDKPLKTKKFEFEALQSMRVIRKGTLTEIENKEVGKKADYLMELANNCFKARDNYIKIVHRAEIECVAAYKLLNAEAFFIDERNTRLLIENPERLRRILEHKLHTKVWVNKENLMKFKKETKGIKIARSVELVIAAYEIGLLDKYMPELKNAGKILLDAVLWGMKLDGCSISRKEIEQIIKYEML